PAVPPPDDRLLGRFLGLRLAVDIALDLDVEEVDLAVDAQHLAVGAERDRRVRELLAAFAELRDRAADERDPVAARPAGHRLDRLAALQRLRGGVEYVRLADRVPLLREDDDIGAGRRGSRDELLGLLEVWALLGAARHLDARDAQEVGHARRIAFADG